MVESGEGAGGIQFPVCLVVGQSALMTSTGLLGTQRACFSGFQEVIGSRVTITVTTDVLFSKQLADPVFALFFTCFSFAPLRRMVNEIRKRKRN